MSEHEEIRQRLVARRSALMERLERFEEQLNEPSDPDAEERSVEREDDEPMESLGLAGQKEIEAIDAALKRFDDGVYGICVTCGDKIRPERLKLVPQTPFCADCARHE